MVENVCVKIKPDNVKWSVNCFEEYLEKCSKNDGLK